MSPSRPVHVVVLAAGEGTRMRSRVPKVLHPVAGKPMVAYVVDAAAELEPADLVVVGPAELDPLRDALGARSLELVVQDPPAGTADAVAVGCAALGKADDADVVLVLNGDCPGIRAATLRALVEAHADADASVLTHVPDDPSGYGRVIRTPDGQLERIVEERDAGEDERAVREVSAGIYCFRLGALRRALERIRPDNVQDELYLPDAFALLREEAEATGDGGDGEKVQAVLHDASEELHGVNDRADLARAEALLRRRKVAALMTDGVTVRDPGAVYVDADVEVGPDTVLYPGVTLESGTRIGEGCRIYPNVRIARSELADGVVVYDASVLEDCRVGRGASIGPWARLRPQADIGPDARIGNFVEVKNSRVGAGAKANHLTYLGDAEVGEGVNVGAGTITCNYDGVRKHRTIVEKGAFIGSNTALVAPVRVGAGAYVGAGSTITEDVPAGALGIARGRQTNKPDWVAHNAPVDDEGDEE